MDDLIVWIDRSIDEVVVNLGRLALRLANPQLTRSSEEREALARSVNQFSICANRSTDPRVQKLAQQLEGTVGPRLRLVAGPPATNLGSCRSRQPLNPFCQLPPKGRCNHARIQRANAL